MASDLEDRLVKQIRDAGLPEPYREVTFAFGRCGRRWKFDLAYGPQMVAIEIQGGSFIRGAHQSGQGAENDAVKASVAALMGWRVFHVNTHMVADGRALYVIQAALGMIDPFEDPVFKLGLWRCEKCDLTKTRRNQKQRQKARESK